MKLLILGASGGCGRWTVRLARERGHSVRVVVRDSTPFEPPAGVEVITGSVLDAATVLDAVSDQDAVVSCLGGKRRSPANPWSKLASPPDFAERSAGHIVDAMAQRGVSVCAAISAAGVGDSRPHTHPVLRWFFEHSTIALQYADLDRMENVYRASDVAPVVVRPTTLVNGPPTTRAKVVDRYRLHSTISRGDVAKWLLDSVESGESVASTQDMIGWR